MEKISRAHAISLGLKFYFTGKPCRNGHISVSYISNGCRQCSVEYREKNKKILAERRRKYKSKNKELVASQRKALYEANKESIKEKARDYYSKNKDKRRRWHAENPMNSFIRCVLRRIEKASGIDRINRAEIALGYSQKDFVAHIESLWMDGMSWDNRKEWHIDHIKPVSLFIKEGITDPIIINALSNLQPLWARDNIIKRAKYNP